MDSIIKLQVHYRYKSIISNPRYRDAQKKTNELADRMLESISAMDKDKEDAIKFSNNRSGWDEQ